MFTYQNLIDGANNSGGDTGSLGNTTLGYPIPYIHKGSYQGAQVLFIGGIHAREYITAPLLLELAKDYKGQTGIWFVPLLNIDGALLVQFGIDSVGNVGLKNSLLNLNDASQDFSLWKANIKGVDLNVNFDAKWGTGAQNVKEPAPGNYIGPEPESEAETKAIIAFTENIRPALTLSYHTKGEEVYWGFLNNDNFKREAERIANTLKYTLKSSIDSAGGYKDWFTMSFGRLGLTVECGNDNFPHPYPENEINNLYMQHKNITYVSAEVAEELWIKYL